MKNFRTYSLCLSILLYGISSSAQTGDVHLNQPDLNKPKQFQALPDNIPVKMIVVNELLSMEVGHPVSIDLSSGTTSFQFEGTVVSSVSQYDNSLLSVVVKSSNYPGARLAISKNTAANGVISYTGMILSMQHGDLYELKNVDNLFVLVKRKFYDLVNE